MVLFEELKDSTSKLQAGGRKPKISPTQKKAVGTYEEFTKKFEVKKTTDDCYTPPIVYDALLDWVRTRYDISPTTRIIRPFYPNGDYQKEDYSGDCVVVDNPPFSILTQIIRYYQAREIPFFIFGQSLTLFNAGALRGVTFLPIDADITYDNGAVVNTGFITNLSPEIKVEGSATLYRVIKEANERNRNEKAPEPKPKYDYPFEVLRAMQVANVVKRGIDVVIKEEDCYFTRALDHQKKHDKAIFGAGFLISTEEAKKMQARAEQARAEQARAAEYIWQLSERERLIIEGLGGGTSTGLL